MLIYEAKLTQTLTKIVQRGFNPAFVVGHRSERSILSNAVAKWATDTTQNITTFVVEGSTGSGKSLIVKEIAFKKTPNVAICQSSVPFEATLAVPFYAMSFIVKAILKAYADIMDESLDLISQSIKYAGMSEEDEAFVAYGLGMKHSHDAWVMKFNPKDRSDMVEAALFNIISAAAKTRKFLVLVDNYQVPTTLI
jgi:hypothetical protein